VRTTWGDAVRGRLHNFDEAALIVLTMTPGALIADALAGQRSCDEHSLAISNDAFTCMRQRRNGASLDISSHWIYGCVSHARRNSAK
jgi:hypothetical protein